MLWDCNLLILLTRTNQSALALIHYLPFLQVPYNSNFFSIYCFTACFFSHYFVHLLNWGHLEAELVIKLLLLVCLSLSKPETSLQAKFVAVLHEHPLYDLHFSLICHPRAFVRIFLWLSIDVCKPCAECFMFFVLSVVTMLSQVLQWRAANSSFQPPFAKRQCERYPSPALDKEVTKLRSLNWTLNSTRIGVWTQADMVYEISQYFCKPWILIIFVL